MSKEKLHYSLRRFSGIDCESIPEICFPDKQLLWCCRAWHFCSNLMTFDRIDLVWSHQMYLRTFWTQVQNQFNFTVREIIRFRLAYSNTHCRLSSDFDINILCGSQAGCEYTCLNSILILYASQNIDLTFTVPFEHWLVANLGTAEWHVHHNFASTVGQNQLQTIRVENVRHR